MNATGPEAPQRARPAASWLAYALPLVLLCAALLPLWIVLRRPTGLFGWAAGAALAALVLWILASVLWPARAERVCPACGAAAVRRLDPGTTHGLVCRSCGWCDAEASGWLLAEEEGPLEPLVLARRSRVRHGPPRGLAPRRGLEGDEAASGAAAEPKGRFEHGG